MVAIRYMDLSTLHWGGEKAIKYHFTMPTAISICRVYKTTHYKRMMGSSFQMIQSQPKERNLQANKNNTKCAEVTDDGACHIFISSSKVSQKK